MIDEKSLTRCWATAFNHENIKLHQLPTVPYFQHEEFDDTIIGKEKRFMPKYEEKCKAPYEGGLFEFFASYPSAEEMSVNCGVDYAGINNHDPNDKDKHTGYFTIDNQSKCDSDSTNLKIDYSIAKFKIAPDFAKQVDFMTARSKSALDIAPVEYKEVTDENGQTTEEVQSISVQLDFEHQLSRINLKSWGNNETYLYEIAGVRIGNANVEGKFHFNTVADKIDNKKVTGPKYVGTWDDSANKKGNVEYIFQPGDTIVTLDGKNANEKKNAVSIMGKSNFAMVIPGKNDKWVRPENPGSVGTGYTTTQSYFSVLMRVGYNKETTGKEKKIYPYGLHSDADIHEKMTVVWLAVKDADGTVVAQVYPGENDDEFFYDKDKTQRYEKQNGVTVKDFGWAAAPIAINWEPGKKYDYNLNYSNGIGLHDPSDPEPGTTILEQSASTVTVDVNVSDWGYFEKETIPVE